MRPLVLMVVLVLAATPSFAQNVRIIERTRDTRTDSLTDRIFKGTADEVHRIVAEWRGREEQLMKLLRVAEADGDPTGRRRAEEEIARNSREAFAMLSAIESRCERERMPRPDGYLGVSLDTEVKLQSGRLVTLGTKVSSVEPGSPAERAGVHRHDLLLAIGGRDARERLPDLSDLLVPGRTVLVRIEREGAVKEIPVVVEPRPKGFAESCGDLERALLPLRAGSFARVIREETGPGGARRVIVGSPVESPRSERPDEVRLFVFGTSSANGSAMSFFAGAEFRALDEDWSERLGVKQGVIVYDVAAGSIAARSGLRGGDVVTLVGTSAATDPMVLVQLLDVHERAEATLTVMRGKERKTVILRWGQP